MNDVYSRSLPQAFPWVVSAPKNIVCVWVKALVSYNNREDCPDGSSFAVDVVYADTWRLWMSDTSYKYLSNFVQKFHPETTDIFQVYE